MALVWLAGACKTELPTQVALDAGISTPCSTYADLLVAYNPEGSEGGSVEGEKALGPPDGQGVPLTANAVLTVAFVGLGSIIDEPGNDLQVHGTFDAGAKLAVYVGFGDGDLVYSGPLGESNLIDFATGTARTVSFVRIVGLQGTANIDALESLQTGCNGP